MKTSPEADLKVQRLPIRLSGDAGRTIARFFWVGESRGRKILTRVRSLDQLEVSQLLAQVHEEFSARPDLDEILVEHYAQAMRQLGLELTDDPDRQRLVGSYFTMEYAHESAALFNPSMVPARDQSGLPEGSVRFLMSLRAVGEGHISSIVFRQGVISGDGQITIDPIGSSASRLRRSDDWVFEKDKARKFLEDTGFYTPEVEHILSRLGERFALLELVNAAEAATAQSRDQSAFREIADRVIWLARANYEIQVPSDQDISKLVLFPIGESESQGMEDMRLVRFTDENGEHRYYGTYTAYNGSRILPQLMVSSQARKVEVHSLHGSFAQNKGLALFPRQVDGQYMIIGRCDAENLYLLRSQHLYNWNEGQILQTPKYPWEFVQIGNCGSPIETDVGWLLLTHGVGPMRKYCMGAILLDPKNPSKVIGHLVKPLMVPLKDERVGYVPNVVYSCGAMLHNGLLVIPYGISDAASGFATVPLKELLAAMA